MTAGIVSPLMKMLSSEQWDVHRVGLQIARCLPHAMKANTGKVLLAFQSEQPPTSS